MGVLPIERENILSVQQHKCAQKEFIRVALQKPCSGLPLSIQNGLLSCVWLLSPFHSSVKSLHVVLCSLGSFILNIFFFAEVCCTADGHSHSLQFGVMMSSAVVLQVSLGDPLYAFCWVHARSGIAGMEEYL